MKTKHLIAALAVVILVFSGFHSLQDSPFLKHLQASLDQYNERYPEETVYLHFDKSFFKPGEDIWFNAFVVNSNTHKPSSLSDVLYVELADPKGNVISKLELLLNGGVVHGDFRLDAVAPGGLYKVKSYTRWMKNFGEENNFSKEITVQKMITPRLLIKLDFEKESYGPADVVSAELTVRDLKNQPVRHGSIHYSIQVDGKNITRNEIQSDADGKANINFTLPSDLKTTDAILLAKINYAGIEESIARSVPIVLNKISISFFPEGGHMVEGIKNRIAFKALNEFEKGADVAGYIEDENRNIIGSFESFHMGMGAFDLVVKKQTKYFARIMKPAEMSSRVPLPTALQEGFSLQLDSIRDMATDWNIYAPQEGPAHFVAQVHGEIVFSRQIDLRKGKNSVSVSTHTFPGGIAMFTLFNNSGVEQCERLVFVNPKKQLSIQITPEKSVYRPGEKVEMEIKTWDENRKPIPAKISLAVVDDQLITFADDKQDNILSSLLVSNELRGEIQEPSFYFNPREAKAPKALDYLLMTQGWRRFTWREVLTGDHPVTWLPEKLKNVSGQLMRNDEGIEGEITLLELGNKRRVLSVKTTHDGHFHFKNTDPSVPLLLLTKKPGHIRIDKEGKIAVSFNDKEGTLWKPERVHDTATIAGNPQVARLEEAVEQGVIDLSMDADVQQLSEVIVTGYGYEKKKMVSASVETIYRGSLDKVNSPGVESSLQGQVAGIVVQPQSANPAARYGLTVRGINSVPGKSEPLYVVDGHPIAGSLNHNFTNGSMIGIEDIETVEVINSPEASALYGSRATNGAILITTASRIGYLNFYSERRASKYNSQYIQPRKFSTVREFYIPPPGGEDSDTRNDFRTTIYWNPEITTDEKGVAKVSFYNNDAISAFRATAEGITGNGLIGRSESVFTTQKPLSLDMRLPDFLGFEDVLRLPVSVKNETSSDMSAEISLVTTEELQVNESPQMTLNVAAGMAKVIWFTIIPRGVEGEFPLTIKAKSKGFEDEMHHKLNVRPAGFPVSLSFSGKDLQKTFTFNINEAEQGSLKAELNAFPDILSDLFTGAESILRQPYGCFEQVSSSNYPNVLALQFLQQSGQGRADTEQRALAYIKDGYKKLSAYEIKGGGFEWFGHPPAHEGLTAYGLIQFHEMKKVYSGVDEKMVNRTRDWLLSRRDNNGGFKQSTGKYGFSAATSRVNNAYLVYALAETGTKNISQEYDEAFMEAMKSGDDYRSALVANAAFSLDKIEDYRKLTERFKEKILAGLDKLKTEHSIVRSYGASLKVETVSLWALALMKPASPEFGLVQQCISELLESRVHGGFGSTQATALALKALTEYSRLVRTTRDDGEINILVNDQVADQQDYDKHENQKITLNGFQKKLAHNGDHAVTVLFNNTREALPYTLNLQWYSRTPDSHEECKLNIHTTLGAPSVKVNENVRLTVTLKNKTAEGLPMAVAVIGLPAGLSLQPWQLKEKQDKSEFDFYEILRDKLVLYYRELAPQASHTLNFDLKAEIPGSFTGAASSAYLYYTDEYKNWAKGNSIQVR